MIKMKGRETGGRPAQPSRYALRIIANSPEKVCGD